VPDRVHISPSFAREAAGYLSAGDVQRAISLCLEGTKLFPNYATGYLVLGKCYEAFGKNREALAQYETALGKLPDNPTLKDLVQRLERQQQEEFRKYLDEQEKRFENTPPASPPPVKEPQPERHEEETTVEYLSKRLQHVKRTQPLPDGTPPPSDSEGEKHFGFATSTMAEILAQQGKYTEAIAAYTELNVRQPDDHYTKRLAELRELQAAQQNAANPDNKKAS
jgi:tetratricopeptide (TPR) repeat protein